MFLHRAPASLLDRGRDALRRRRAGRVRRAVAALSMLLVSAGALADPPVNRPVLEQKVKLLDSYLGSATIRRIETATNAEAKAQLEEAKRLFAAARAALVAGDLEAAAQGLDTALRKISTAASAAARTRPVRDAAQERARYDRLRSQIESYIEALGRAAPSGGAGAAGPQAQLSRLLADATARAGAGRYAAANEVLARAYQAAVAAIAAQRKGQTAVFRLNFETPADEYEYERKRNGSYSMLIDIMMDERPSPPESLKVLVARMVGESQALRDEAAAAAQSGDYVKAINILEQATGRLVRALRAGGLPIPE